MREAFGVSRTWRIALALLALIVLILARYGRGRQLSEGEVLQAFETLVASGLPHGEADLAAELSVYPEELQPTLEAMYGRGILVQALDPRWPDR